MYFFVKAKFYLLANAKGNVLHLYISYNHILAHDICIYSTPVARLERCN